MSLIYLAVLYKAAEEQKKRTRARQASTQKSDSKIGNNYSSQYNCNIVDIVDFIDDLLVTDQEATKLFLLLKDCLDQVNEEDYQESLEEVQRICKEYEEQDFLLKKEMKKVKALGITFDMSKSIEKFACAVKVPEGQGFGRYGSYSYNIAKYCIDFIGMPLTKEMLENNINQFQIDLEKFNEENPNLEEQLTEIQSKITKQKKSIKYSPFNKSKKQSLLSKMLSIEKNLKEKIAKRTILETQSKSFAKLTPEQKKAIISYLDQVANCITVGEQLSNAIHRSIVISNYNQHRLDENRNIHQRMLEKAVEQSEFTMEDINTILTRIKAIIDEHKIGYNEYEKLDNKHFTTSPNTPESMFAAMYYDKFYKEKTKSKNKSSH